MVLFTGVRPKPEFGPFELRPWVKFSKFWPGETSDLYTNGPESFPAGCFTHFGHPKAKNYESVFSTVVRPSGVFKKFLSVNFEKIPSCVNFKFWKKYALNFEE